MPTDTRWTLDQSRFFLEKMRGLLANPREFTYYLNAFISSARSVTFIMQEEFSRRSGFTSWYESRQAELRKDPTFQYFNEHRRLLTHVRALKEPSHAFIHNPDELLRGYMAYVVTGTGSTLRLVIQDDVQERRRKVLGNQPDYFFEDVNDKSVLEMCDSYVNELANLVETVESQFPL